MFALYRQNGWRYSTELSRFLLLYNCCRRQVIQREVAGQFQSCDHRRRSQITRKDASQIVANWHRSDIFNTEGVCWPVCCCYFSVSQSVIHEGKFPMCFKTAEVLPLLKKSGADQGDPANFRPISNLSTISKVLERLALAHLRPHLLSSVNFCPFQSGYRTGHSTETALFE